MKKYSKSNHRRCSIKNVFCAKAFFLVKLLEACSFFKKETLKRRFLSHRTPPGDCLWYSDASSCSLNCNLILSLQFVTINFTFSLLWVVTVVHDSVSYFKSHFPRPLIKKNNSKAQYSKNSYSQLSQ